MPPSNSTASRYSVHSPVLKVNASAILLYSPECMEGVFCELRQKNPLACNGCPHTANGEPQAWLLY